MSRPARKPREPAADLGPTIRVERGDVLAEFRPDPDNPQRGTVKGGRASQGGHDYLGRRGSLDAVQVRVAQTYADAWHGCQRSGCSIAPEGTVRLPPHMQGHPLPAQLDAARKLRDADEALGQGAVILVRRVAVQGWTLGTIGGAAGEGDQVTLGRLRAALDRLAEMWGEE